MNLDVCPQKSRIAPASKPHHSPWNHGEDIFAKRTGNSSRQPSRYSQIIFKQMRVFIIHPANKRRKKNMLVGRSMQKKAHTRFTITKVIAQLTNLPAREPCLLSLSSEEPAPSPAQLLEFALDHQRCIASNIPCHAPQTRKFNPAPCHSPLRNIVISTFRYTRCGLVLEPPRGMNT